MTNVALTWKHLTDERLVPGIFIVLGKPYSEFASNLLPICLPTDEKVLRGKGRKEKKSWRRGTGRDLVHAEFWAKMFETVIP